MVTAHDHDHHALGQPPQQGCGGQGVRPGQPHKAPMSRMAPGPPQPTSAHPQMPSQSDKQDIEATCTCPGRSRGEPGTPQAPCPQVLLLLPRKQLRGARKGRGGWRWSLVTWSLHTFVRVPLAQAGRRRGQKPHLTSLGNGTLKWRGGSAP